MKKALKITGITLAVLLLLLFLIPVVFKKQITALVKKEINKSLTAKVDFSDVSLSLFRRFPKVSISIEDVQITGSGAFAADTLIAAKRIDASANIISIIRGSDISISGVHLVSPRIHALVNKDGQANWDIVKPGEESAAPDTDTSTSSFRMSLKSYSISDGYIRYKDETAGINTIIEGLDHKGSGDFTADAFTLSTSTRTASASFIYNGIPYLASARTGIDADLQIDTKESKYSFDTEEITVNNLKLAAKGFFQLINDSTYGMDISFKSPSNDFKDILSLVPAIYKTDFDKIKTTGKAAVEGMVKGTYTPQQLPAYDVKLAVQDASFQYPDLPGQVKNIQVDLHAANPDGRPDNAVINLSKGHLEMNNEPLDFHFLFKNPETAQYIDAVVKGKLDLSQVSRFIKLEGDTKLAGIVAADAYAKGNMSALQSQQGPFAAGGFFDVSGLSYSAASFPQPVRNGNMKIQLANTGGVADNTIVSITNGHIEVGNDPVDFTLQLSKPVSAVNFSGAAKGQFTLDHVKQFVSLDPGTSLAGLLKADMQFAGNKMIIDKGEYDKMSLSGSAGISNLRYTAPEYSGGISVPVVNAVFTPRHLSITQFEGHYLGTKFTGSGALDNLIGYAAGKQPLKGTLNVEADKMDLNQWMGTAAGASGNEAAPAATSSGVQPFLVPADLDLLVHARAGEVVYDKLPYKNIQGSLQLADETVRLQNIKLEALEGTLQLNGSYSTKNSKTDPAIFIAYDVKDLDVQKTFLAFNTVQMLMPIAQFIDGKISSQLQVAGSLNGAMMPDLKSLSGKGNLFVLEGVIRKFAPLDKIASTLQIDALKEVTVKDIRNYIEFDHGKVLVKPFTVKVKDIEMQIGGTHGLDKSIDYIVAMKVPRKYIGDQGNNLLNSLQSQAASRGIPVNLSEIIDLNIKLGGSMTNPTIKTDLKEVAGDAVEDLKQQAENFAQAKIDSAKSTIKDSVSKIKNEVMEDLKEEVKNKIFGTKDSASQNNIDSTKKNAEKTIKNTINNLFKKKKNDTDTIKN